MNRVPLLLQSLAVLWDIEPSVMWKIWRALDADDSSADAVLLKTELRQIDWLSGFSKASLRAGLHRWCNGSGRPTLLLGLLENYVSSGALKRKDLTQFEAAVLDRTNSHGDWILT